MVILAAQNLGKRYGDFWALKGVSFKVLSGRSLVVLGPNGAGKSTLFHLISGLFTPDEGEISLWEKGWASHRRDLLERIGVLFQETHLYKKATVYETLCLFRSFYKKGRDPKYLMDAWGLSELKDRRLETLSGGQKKRVYLGCALIHKPELLILDEPTAALDPEARRGLWALLEQEVKEGMGLIVATHDVTEAERYGDDVLVFRKGNLVASGDRESLKPKTLVLRYQNPSSWQGPGKFIKQGWELEISDLSEWILLEEKARKEGVTLTLESLRRTSWEDLFFGESL